MIRRLGGVSFKRTQFAILFSERSESRPRLSGSLTSSPHLFLLTISSLSLPHRSSPPKPTRSSSLWRPLPHRSTRDTASPPPLSTSSAPPPVSRPPSLPPSFPPTIFSFFFVLVLLFFELCRDSSQPFFFAVCSFPSLSCSAIESIFGAGVRSGRPCGCLRVLRRVLCRPLRV